MNLRAQAFLLVSAALAAACAHSSSDGSRAAQTTTTGASFGLPGSSSSDPQASTTEPFTAQSLELAQPEHPANKLGTAMCERKQECDDIGGSKQYASMHDCLTATRTQAHEALDAMSCENGIDMKAFSTCEKAVRKAECAEVDSMKTIDACTGARLCMR